MYKTKRDVDNHWSEINRKIPSETERNLKAWTVAKLYFNVGEHDLAVKFLDKYDSARKNAPQVIHNFSQSTDNSRFVSAVCPTSADFKPACWGVKIEMQN